MLPGIIFLLIVISFLLGVEVGKLLKRKRKSFTAVVNAGERDRIVAHRNKMTLIIPPDKPAEDSTQVLYFATRKGFVNGKYFN